MKFIRDVWKFFAALVNMREAIYELAKREFQAQNKDTYLGVVWGYIQPLTYIMLLVVVFNVGLRANPGGPVPFMVYLITGMIAWQFFSGTLTALTSVVKRHAFLVKKGDFRLGILHVAKIISALIPHLALLAAALIISWSYCFKPDLYTLQLVYYMTAAFFLLLGLGWITSSTSLFVQDVSNVVSIMTLFGFWLTPIIWNIKRIPPAYRWIVKLNPMCYVVNGYRDCLVYKVAFWEKPMETLYFWTVTALLLLVGVVLFRKLKPHFGEVL